MTIRIRLALFALISFPALGAPVETLRFDLELARQVCTGHEGQGFLCSGDSTRAPIEVPLERVKASEIENLALEGTSETLGLALDHSVRHFPVVNVRKSVVGSTSIYTLRFRSGRNETDTKMYETVYIEEGERLAMEKPLTLMADRFGNGVRFSGQLFLTLRKQP